MMWKIDIYKREKNGNRGKLKTTSKYPTKELALRAQRTLQVLSKGWVIGIGYDNRPTPRYNMNNIIVADPVEVQC